MSAPPFVCPRCSAKSYHPEDLRRGWCGLCHAFTGGGMDPACAPRHEKTIETHNRSGRPSPTALEAAAALPSMPGRLDSDYFWPDRFFVEPNFEAVLASWRARGWKIEFHGEPLAWGVQAVKGDGLYEMWASEWDTWRRALERSETDLGGSNDRAAYEATKPTPERTWLVGCQIY